MSNVLEGIRVLDFGRFIAGPYCAALLADYGADVIRIEPVGGSDDRWLTPVTDQGEGSFFLQVNRNKRCLALDMTSVAGQEVIERLIRQADVVIANMPPRALARLGLDYESLRALKPDIILTASTAFGKHPSASNRVGFDGVGQTISGAVHMGGYPEHPMKAMVPVIDFGTGLSCALGTMMALFQRQATGMGQEVHASLLHTGLNFSSGALIEEAALKLDRKAMGNRAPTYAPSDIFKAKDGWLIVQVIGQGMFKRWAHLIDRSDLIDDPRFADDVSRGVHGEELCGLMSEWCGQRTRAEAIETLEKARIPAGPVLSPREVLADEMINLSGAINWLDTRTPGQQLPIIAPPFQLSRTPSKLQSPAPTPGEHTWQILEELGYGKSDIEKLQTLGVI